MGLVKDLADMFKAAALLDERVKGLTEDVVELAQDIEGIDRRLVKVETYLQIATGKRQFQPRGKE
jgi:hypothetical protein